MKAPASSASYRRRHQRLLGRTAVACVLASASCATAQSVALEQATVHLRCPADRITVSEIELGRYRAVGCGRVAVYICGDELGDTCMQEGG